jgi:hypothetical protein
VAGIAVIVDSSSLARLEDDDQVALAQVEVDAAQRMHLDVAHAVDVAGTTCLEHEAAGRMGAALGGTRTV